MSCSSLHVPHASCHGATTATTFFCCKAESSCCAEVRGSLLKHVMKFPNKRASCFNDTKADHLQCQGGSALKNDAGTIRNRGHLQRFVSGIEV